MQPKLLLRIASGAMIFHLIGHSLGQSSWKQTADTVKQGIISQMTGHKFPFMGSERSMGDYYEGYGWACSIAMLFFAFVLWAVSSSTNENINLTRKILTATTVCLYAWCIDEFIFFFPFAASTTLLAAGLSTMALYQLKPKE